MNRNYFKIGDIVITDNNAISGEILKGTMVRVTNPSWHTAGINYYVRVEDNRGKGYYFNIVDLRFYEPI
jgi:hypothetical protein